MRGLRAAAEFAEPDRRSMVAVVKARIIAIYLRLQI